MANFTGRTTTNITLHLIIINVILLLADGLLERRGISLSDMLGLHYLDSEKFHWWQLVTYMFMHGNLTHLFNNMFSLYMFGRLLEMVWGEQRFLLYYFVTGIGAGLIQQLAWSYELNNFIAQFATNDVFRQQILNMSHTQLLEVDGVMNILNQLVTVGASGSVFGILLAFVRCVRTPGRCLWHPDGRGTLCPPGRHALRLPPHPALEEPSQLRILTSRRAERIPNAFRRHSEGSTNARRRLTEGTTSYRCRYGVAFFFRSFCFLFWFFFVLSKESKKAASRIQ